LPGCDAAPPPHAVKPEITNPATATKSRCRIIAYVAFVSDVCFRRRPGSGKTPLGLES
jgi:hypothetical protein